MFISQAIILSVVEGLTEFLPISSTAHLVLASALLSIEQTNFVKSFEIVIQLGAIVSVVFLYWRRFFVELAVLKKLVVAFVPTSIVGFIFYGVIKNLLIGDLLITVLALFVGGVAIIALEKLVFVNNRNKGVISKMTLGQAFGVGVFQSLSVVPGVSRAAASIYGGMFAGLSRAEAVEFSFLLAVPTMVAATGLDLLKNYQQFNTDQLGVLAVGFVGSFVIALTAIKFLIAYSKNNNFIIFGIYRIIISGIFYVIFLT